MELIVRLPQLDELNAEIKELRKALNLVHEIGVDTASDVGLAVKTVLALDKRLDTLASATAAPEVVQLDLPTAEQSTPTPRAKRARRVTAETKPTPPATETVKGNGEAHDDDDEEALRARVAFEAKRVSRTLGIGGMRAAIKKVTGENIMQVDDVPARQLSALLSELQAM